jgi:hypothetical protein
MVILPDFYWTDPLGQPLLKPTKIMLIGLDKVHQSQERVNGPVPPVLLRRFLTHDAFGHAENTMIQAKRFFGARDVFEVSSTRYNQFEDAQGFFSLLSTVQRQLIGLPFLQGLNEPTAYVFNASVMTARRFEGLLNGLVERQFPNRLLP